MGIKEIKLQVMSTSSGSGITIRPLFIHKHTLEVLGADPPEPQPHVLTWTHPASAYDHQPRGFRRLGGIKQCYSKFGPFID